MLGREISAEGGSRGLVVMGYNSCSKGCVFESRRQIPDGDLDIFHTELLFGNDRKKKKEDRVGPFLKKRNKCRQFLNKTPISDVCVK